MHWRAHRIPLCALLQHCERGHLLRLAVKVLAGQLRTRSERRSCVLRPILPKCVRRLLREQLAGAARVHRSVSLDRFGPFGTRCVPGSERVIEILASSNPRPGGPKALPPRGSHRPVRPHISAYGTSHPCIRCVPESRADRAIGSERVSTKDDKKFLPGQRAEVVAAVKPPPPLLSDLMKKPSQRSRVSRYSLVRIVSA